VPSSVTAVESITGYLDNVVVTEALLSAIAQLKIGVFVDISSVSVYCKNAPVPFNEDDTVQPDNSYGISKVTTELLVDLYSRTYGFRAVTLRVSQVLGYRAYKTKGFFSMLLENSVQKKPLVMYGKGEAARDYVYVKDVVHAIMLALECDSAKGIYNIGNGVPVTNRALIDSYHRVFENPHPIKVVDLEKEDTRFWYMDIKKANRDFGYVPAYGLDEMVEDIKAESSRLNKTTAVNTLGLR